MTEGQIESFISILKEIAQFLKKIEENTRPETVEEKRNRIRGFANEKDNSPF